MRFTTLSDWLSWQETLHPQEIDLGLERVAAVWKRMEASLDGVKVITVAGTNGKGSCVAMLESILLAAAYHVGSYTSPHLQHYNERIRIDGRMAGDDLLCQSFERVDQARGEDSLSYFEFGTLAALSIFSEQQPDVVLLEVGLGGRLDAVNIIDADVALISSVAIDHSDWLGADRDSIGFEKAGIFRQGRPAVCGDPEPPVSVLEQARCCGAELSCLGRDFYLSPAGQGSCWSWHSDIPSVNDYCDLPRPGLEGRIQLNNAASVLQVLSLLRHELPLDVDVIGQGLRQVCLPGRYQRIYCSPPLQRCKANDGGAVEVIADVAHNPAAAIALAQILRDDRQKNDHQGATRAVIAMLDDKDVAAVVAALNDVVDHWYVTEPAVSRACPAADLLAVLGRLRDGDDRCSILVYASVREAVQQALLDASVVPERGDRLLVVGSFYTVTEFLGALST